jgi:hypothetical protein
MKLKDYMLLILLAAEFIYQLLHRFIYLRLKYFTY